MHIRHADDDEEIKKREWKKERQIHRNSRNAELRTRMTGRREGIKQGSVYILLLFSRVNTLWLNEFPLRLHVLPKTLKAKNHCECV